MCTENSSKISLRSLGHSTTVYQSKRNWIGRITTEALDAFKPLSSKLVKHSELALSQPHTPYMIETNATAYALEAVLLQQQNDSNVNECATMGNWSRTLNLVEQNYLTAKREWGSAFPWYGIYSHSAHTSERHLLKFERTTTPSSGCSYAMIWMKG